MTVDQVSEPSGRIFLRLVFRSLLLAGYLVLLTLAYDRYYSQMFAVDRYPNELSSWKLVLGVIAVMALAPVGIRGTRPSDVLLQMVVGIIVAPSLAIIAAADLPFAFAAVTLGAFLLVVLVARIAPQPQYASGLVAADRLSYMLVVITFVYLFALIASGGWRYFNISLAAVYDLRQNVASALPPVFAYLNSLFAKVAIPFAMVLAFEAKHPATALMLAVASFLIFAVTAHKSPLFYPIVILSLYVAMRLRWKVELMHLGLIAIVGLSIADMEMTNAGDANEYSGWFATLFLRRALYVPSVLNFYYFDFFQAQFETMKYYWSESRITLGLIPRPYDLRVVNLIGSEYFGRDEMSANAGWIGSGLANAGYFGVALYSIGFGFVLGFLDARARSLGLALVGASFALLVLTIAASSDFLTVLLTHGLLLALLLLLILKPRSASGTP